MTQPALGEVPTLVDERDAVHIPIIAVRAAQRISPGDYITRRDGGYVIAFRDDDCIGIADPYRNGHINPGDLFWVEQNGEDARSAWYELSPEGRDTFWRHMKNAEGITPPEDPDWPEPFSCSC